MKPLKPEEWAELHKKLSEPFPAEAIKSASKKGGKYRYVTARAVMNRLDAAAGPGNWRAEFSVVDGPSGTVKCALTIFEVTCEGIGDPNNTPSAGSLNGQIYKEAESDSLKRAAVYFGVGRYLYEPDYERDEPDEVDRQPQQTHAHSDNLPLSPPADPTDTEIRRLMGERTHGDKAQWERLLTHLKKVAGIPPNRSIQEATAAQKQRVLDELKIPGVPA